MAWTAPMTAVANATFTAAEFNTHIRDNLLETEPAKALTLWNYFVTTAANTITTRASVNSRVLTQQSTSSTTYTDLATVGPAVTVTTGTRAIVFIQAGVNTTSTDSSAFFSVAVTGATTIAQSDTWACIMDGTQGNFNFSGNPKDQHNRRMITKMFTTLNAGSNTFTMKYKVGSATAHFHNREIIVLPL